MKKISFTITTKSNLFIGGTPTTFEIGGVDQYTVTDYEGNPYIPGSSLKGTLRSIVRDLSDDTATDALNKMYQEYCVQLTEEAQSKLPPSLNEDEKKRFEKRQNEINENCSAEYLFGIEGFNQTPKILFSDLELVNAGQPTIFSIDSKNSVTKSEDNQLSAVPRTYKTVAPNITFQGEILFQYAQKMSDVAGFIEEAEKLLDECFHLLSSGYYRLGNSGSRGYGRVDIQVKEPSHENN